MCWWLISIVNMDSAPGLPYINFFSFTGFLTAFHASCWSLMAENQRRRSSADIHGSSWVAPKLQQLSLRVCCAPREKSPCTDLLDATSVWDHLCSSLVPRCVWGDLLLEVMGVRTIQTGCWIKPRAGCGNYINQLIIPLSEPPVHSLVSELGFFAFLQSSWRWDVEHGVLLLLMVLKKNISSAGWHIVIVYEGKISARFGAGKTLLQIDLQELLREGSRELGEHWIEPLSWS